MSVLEAIIYGLVQGLTEFLPVSSSGHLALFNAFIFQRSGTGGFDEPLTMSILVHVASLLAILFAFRREVLALLTRDRRLGLFILAATVPAMIAGLLFHDALEQINEQPVLVAILLMMTGLVLAAGEVFARRRRALCAEHEMSFWQAISVGVAQAFALLPGISRSGTTISAARALGLTREGAVRFSFLLAIPAIAAAGGYESLEIFKNGFPNDIGFVAASAGFIASFVSSLLAIMLLLNLVRRVGLWVFSPYLWVIGSAAILYFGR